MFKIISKIEILDDNELKELTSIIFSLNGGYYYLVDKTIKLKDINKMPKYIKRDWLEHNKKEIDITILNKQISLLEADSINLDEDISEINNLKKIREKLIKKGLI